jgi:protein involved in sex pheromone biosynthesis
VRDLSENMKWIIDDNLKDGCTCWECKEKIEVDDYVYSAGVLFKKDINRWVDGEPKNIGDALEDKKDFEKEYLNDKEVEKIYISNAFCPHCLSCLN